MRKNRIKGGRQTPYKLKVWTEHRQYYKCAGLGSQCCNVVLVKGRINLGSGFLNGKQMGRDGEEEISLEQPGTRVDGSYRSKEGSK